MHCFIGIYLEGIMHVIGAQLERDYVHRGPILIQPNIHGTTVSLFFPMKIGLKGDE